MSGAGLDSRHARTVVITGASQGLGKGLAQAFLARGHRVAISSHEASAIAVACDDLARAAPGRVIAAKADVADADQLQGVWDAAVTAFGGVDIWINNAGLARGNLPLAQQSTADMEAMLRTNVLGTVNGCQVALRGMRAGGAIYNLSGAGSDGAYVPGMIGYATTKVAVTHFTRWLADETAGQGIIVGALSPGLVLTEGFWREHAAVPPAARPAREAVVNLIGDDVPTVSRWFAGKILANTRTGVEFVWLTPGKIRWRKVCNVFVKRRVLPSA
jgi:NAD(P)-dependent dehydrogenase (short-subunit alcohol dehydrogenase family)